MPKFVSIPTEIEAIQYQCPEWTEDNKEPFWDDNFDEVESWIYSQTPEEDDSDYPKEYFKWVNDDVDSVPVKYEYMTGHYELWVDANQAWLPIERNEWIIKDSIGFYPCKNEVFVKKYRKAD